MKILSDFCVAFLRAYQWFLSPLLSSLGAQCRFIPTCSEYAVGSVKTHGPFTGGWLAARRLLRCHPFCEGGHDPVPGRSHHWECSNG